MIGVDEGRYGSHTASFKRQRAMCPVTNVSTGEGRLFLIADGSPFPSAAHRQCQPRPTACPPLTQSDLLPRQHLLSSHMQSPVPTSRIRNKSVTRLGRMARCVSISDSGPSGSGDCSRPYLRLAYRKYIYSLPGCAMAPAAISSCLAGFRTEDLQSTCEVCPMLHYLIYPH